MSTWFSFALASAAAGPNNTRSAANFCAVPSQSNLGLSGSSLKELHLALLGELRSSP